jgi:hypothetical protein
MVSMTSESTFDCNDLTQIESLVKELWKIYPQYTDTDIRRAIKVCYDNFKTPTTKEKFMECVGNNIRWLNI